MTEPKERPTAAQFSVKEELHRKSIHIGMIVIPLWLFLTPHTVGLLGLIIATFVTVVLDLLRLNDRRARRFFMALFRSMLRRHEEEHLTGATHFMIAAVLCYVALDEPVAIAALTFLVVGDTAAAIAGKKWGRPMYWGKSPHGSVACFLVCFAFGFWILGDYRIALVGGAAAAVSEALPVPMDDNMRVPIFSGLVMQLMSQYLQG